LKTLPKPLTHRRPLQKQAPRTSCILHCNVSCPNPSFSAHEPSHHRIVTAATLESLLSANLSYHATVYCHWRASPWPPLPHRGSVASSQALVRHPSCSLASTPPSPVRRPQWTKSQSCFTTPRPSPQPFLHKNKFEIPGKLQILHLAPWLLEIFNSSP
jgi:hypothetical protein